MNKSPVSNLCLYFRKPAEQDRFFPGDRFLRPLIRNLIRGKKIGGVEKVFINLCKGFDKLKIPYTVNKPFKQLTPADKVIVLGNGHYSLEGYKQPNKIIAGIGLMTHPTEWPELLQDYPVAKYLQHSDWANNVYKPYYGDTICDTWFAGIETDKWSPDTPINKSTDFLIYNKVRWNKEEYASSLINPIKETLQKTELTFKEIVYGSYKEEDYFKLLKECKAMIFLCEHESQGFACCEALSMNVPVFAWNNGFCLDPNRHKWGNPVIPGTSIPFFDERCGERFQDFKQFEEKFSQFLQNVKSSTYKPRDYITENLTLEKSAKRMIEIVNEVYR